MASLPIWWIAARTYCQATEAEDRVARALDAVAAAGIETRDRVEGQFGNPVVVLIRRIEGGDAIRETWKRWQEAGLLHALGGSLDGRLDEEGVLHFRIDKEAAFAGRLLSAGDADAIDIQVKLKAYPANPEEILRVARSLFPEVG